MKKIRPPKYMTMTAVFFMLGPAMAQLGPPPNPTYDQIFQPTLPPIDLNNIVPPNQPTITAGVPQEQQIFMLGEQIQQAIRDMVKNCSPNVNRGPANAAPDLSVPEKTMSMGAYTRGARGTLQIVNGCDKNAAVQAGYNSDTKCGKIPMHPGFAKHMDKNFLKCTTEAAAAAGLPKPSRVFINHKGCYNNRNVRNGRTLSLHAHGRALDIGAINLIDATGKKTKMSMHIRDYRSPANAKFYDTLRACWRRSVGCAKGSIGHTRSQMGGNNMHADHLHLEYPHCAR